MRILSGIQPTGRPHLGNYFGMMKPAIELAKTGQSLYFIADYHALTSVHDPEALRQNVFECAVDFLACGLDPESTIFYRQSDLPEVTELTWILSTVTGMGLLERCHSYKDKTAKGIAPSHALFSYPVLMAADILMYDSDLVPVGEDQKQHLEVTRDIVNKINDRYGEDTLKLPEPLIREATAKVPGLDGQKMSKSYNNTIPIAGDQKPIRKLFMRITTDSTPVEDPKPTENSLILDFYRLFATDAEYDQMIADYQAGGTGYGDFKKRLFEAYWDHFAPIRAKREELLNAPDYIEQVLQSGAARAREIAAPVLHRVRQAVGLRK